MKHLLAVLIVGVLLASLALPALALKGGLIVVDNVVTLRIRADAGGMNIQEREDAITVRLNALLGCPKIFPRMIHVSRRGGDPVIMYGKTLLVDVDRKTASMNGENQWKLAKKWARSLRRLLPKAKAENCGVTNM